MIIPVATYRVQFHRGFSFKDFKEIIPYLHRLGISTIYASPIFEATPGSTHGYDIVNPHKLNPEIGTLEEWREISRELKLRGMSWLQDIVPNHMAYHGNNQWLQDVFEKGSASQYYHFFDVDWKWGDPDFHGKLLAPFLGDELETVLENQELQLELHDDGLYFKYYENRFALSARSYPFVLNELMFDGTAPSSTRGVLDELVTKMSLGDSAKWEKQKQSFLELVNIDQVNLTFAAALKKLSKNKDKVRQIVDLQFYKLAPWQTTETEINYRRFFTINGLICLRMEDEAVFNEYHKFVKELCDEGLADGLRIDHIDGLFDPKQYLERLQKLVGSQYTVVEKILENDEQLPDEWPVQGDTGYSFLATVNKLFTNAAAKDIFDKEYQNFTTNTEDYDQLVFEKKQWLLKNRMGGELENLYRIMKQHSFIPDDTHTSKFLWKQALGVYLCSFPVYRIYPEDYPLAEKDYRLLVEIRDKAIERMPTLKDEVEYLLDIFTGKTGKDKTEMLFFLKRCQQFTGPLAAKGLEDTAFYLYNRLISQNEVGDSPSIFGISPITFHDKMKYRQAHFPFAINGTSTHDTKRGEDARMRIAALSYLQDEWFSKVKGWTKLTKKYKQNNAPDGNEEYLIYQILLGAWPLDGDPGRDFLVRTKTYLQKVLREAKLHSNWALPDEKYEENVFQYVEKTIADPEFSRSFEEFAEKAIHIGRDFSLGQTVLKMMAPGVPDVYQGTELWDLSYVDPDNRREVDFRLRQEFLDDISRSDPPFFHWIENWKDGRIKMYITYRCLQLRTQLPAVFEKGQYTPISVIGADEKNVICFVRYSGNDWVLVFVKVGKKGVEENSSVWQSLIFPNNAPKEWLNIFSRTSVSWNPKLQWKELFNGLPVAVLKNMDNGI